LNRDQTEQQCHPTLNQPCWPSHADPSACPCRPQVPTLESPCTRQRRRRPSHRDDPQHPTTAHPDDVRSRGARVTTASTMSTTHPSLVAFPPSPPAFLCFGSRCPHSWQRRTSHASTGMPRAPRRPARAGSPRRHQHTRNVRPRARSAYALPLLQRCTAVAGGRRRGRREATICVPRARARPPTAPRRARPRPSPRTLPSVPRSLARAHRCSPPQPARAHSDSRIRQCARTSTHGSAIIKPSYPGKMASTWHVSTTSLRATTASRSSTSSIVA
jgi:hypothetical protein